MECRDLALVPRHHIILKCCSPIDKRTPIRRSAYVYHAQSALIAENNGLADLEKIIEIGCSILKSGGKIALEHGFMQQEDVANLLKQYGYKVVQLGSDNYHPRFVIATYG